MVPGLTPVQRLGELRRRFDEDDVAGRDPDVVVPGKPFEVDFSVMHQRTRRVPFADP